MNADMVSIRCISVASLPELDVRITTTSFSNVHKTVDSATAFPT